jgi:integrase
MHAQVLKLFSGDTRLSTLTVDVLLDKAEDLHDEGLAGSTLNKRFFHLSVLFDHAIEDKNITGQRYIGPKPKMPKYRVSTGRMRVVTPAEEAEALRILRDPRGHGRLNRYALAHLVEVLCDTGLRLSEALSIEPSRINHEMQALLVLRSKNDVATAIPLSQRTFAFLGAADPLPGHSVFHPLTKSSANQAWRKVRAKMGLEDDLEFVLHALRHTFGTTHANAGTDAFRLQNLMGHKQMTTTLKYVHVNFDALKGLSSVMENRIKGTDLEYPKPAPLKAPNPTSSAPLPSPTIAPKK